MKPGFPSDTAPSRAPLRQLQQPEPEPARENGLDNGRAQVVCLLPLYRGMLILKSACYMGCESVAVGVMDGGIDGCRAGSRDKTYQV